MAKKKRPTRPGQLPPHIAEAQRLARLRTPWRPRPEVPRRRAILGVFGLSMLGLTLSLALWIPPYSLLRDLRDHGTTAAAVVTEVDNKPKYVKVRFVQGPESGSEVKLGDYAGMYPAAQTGDTLRVTYDPDDPSRSLSESWVIDPPTNLPAFGASALAAFFLVGALIGAVRRRRMLRVPATRSSPPAPA